MPEFWDNLMASSAVRNATSGGKFVYGFVVSQLWPAFSTGMVLGSVFVIAAMHEKQTLADHLYGAKGNLAGTEGEAAVGAASQLLDDEVQRAVKADVYAMPKGKFDAECAEYTVRS
jgi:hypothetical protein